MPAIPQGFNTITPTLVLEDAAKAISLYVKAFGAKEDYRMEYPGSKKIMHACLTIGNSKLFLCDTNEQMCSEPSSSNFYLYVDNVDATYQQARQAGLDEKSPVLDMFWGDRTGCLTDSFGITWTLATHVRDVSPEEMEEAKNKWGKAA